MPPHRHVNLLWKFSLIMYPNKETSVGPLKIALRFWQPVQIEIEAYRLWESGHKQRFHQKRVTAGLRPPIRPYRRLLNLWAGSYLGFALRPLFGHSSPLNHHQQLMEKVIDNPANASSIDKGGSTTDIEGSSSFQSEQSPARIPRLNRK